MHTFFINTSKKDLSGYDVLFDLHYENKTLISMDCLMTDWYDNDKGYNICIKQMCDLIDGFVELNNSFNLILYIDLPENKAYSSIQRDEFNDKKRDVFRKSMHILYTHVVSETIVKELEDTGRKPQNVLIMFGEEKRFSALNIVSSNINDKEVMSQVFSFMGLPTNDVIESTAKEILKTDCDDHVVAFKEKIIGLCEEELVPGILSSYSLYFDLWCDKIINEKDIDDANVALYKNISRINENEEERTGIKNVCCPYDSYACRGNKAMLALSKINIAIHILKCIENNSIYKTDNESGERQLLEFNIYTFEELQQILYSKKTQFSKKALEIEGMDKSYSELGFFLPLKAFDHAKFGLDMYGEEAIELIVNDSENENNDKKEDNDDGDKKAEDVENSDSDNDVIVLGNDKEVVAKERQYRHLLTKEEFEPFDYTYDVDDSRLRKMNVNPQEYIKAALNLRKHHLDILKKLNLHVSKAMSNYAGKSKENKPALLQIGGQRYAAPTKNNETKVLEEVEEVSEKAYETMVNQYMEFCAGRSVAITDIEDQCNWFVTRINQIKESLRKLKLVALGILIGIILLYIPYVVIQFESIISNVLTITTAICSIAIPIVLLYVVFLFLVRQQKKKYIKAWADFKEKSDQALEENKIAVMKYDQLLYCIIPSLRWVYEYKMDVDYRIDCCSVADAKLEHHRRKLRSRVISIQNMQSDLEIRDPEFEAEEYPKVFDEIDYNSAFCSGKKNKSFYAIFDSLFFNPPLK